MSRLQTVLRLLICSALLLTAPHLRGAEPAAVTVSEQQIVIPTYLAGAPEPNPIFHLGRESQGAQGRVYPYPLYDILTHQKVDKSYTIVYLENEYVRIGILPEIGGRLFEGVDKTNNYNFIYRQHVIKPALIGLIGAWISGGIEWNIPHHHRASTFLPVQYQVEEGADGAKTVWVGELEVRHRMRWAVGYTLRPGKSYFEAQVRILNRTPVVNSMLCFANVAVHVNDNYQVIFPPGTQYGTFHGKREFVKWPMADSVYAGADFTKGVDVSWYKNHINANSIFAWNYSDDFFAGYDHGKQAGTMSVADHNIVPGKKVWTWGSGPRGRMWDHILTDEDGPYDELMVGAYSDNQPDYSWLQPYDVKSFSMHWYPFRDIGGVKKANLDAAVNLEVAQDGSATVAFYTTSARPKATVSLRAGAKVLLEETVAIDPARPYRKQVAIPAGVDQHDLRASISADGKELVSYSPVRLTPEPMPKPVTPPAAPKDIKTNEELYLTGLRAEQFHDPAIDPEAYWEEALRRDPGDARVNTALGITYYKKARFAEAEKLFRTALARLTDRYTTPKDAESEYYLGLTLKAQGRLDEAYAHLYKSTWSLAWRAAGYYGIAEIAATRGDFSAALNFTDRSIDNNALNIRALNLKAAILRHLDRKAEALDVLATARRKADPLDVRLMAEQWLASGDEKARMRMADTMNLHPATASETAAEYLDAGLWQDGTSVLDEAVRAAPDKAKVHPMVYYYLGYFAGKMKQPDKASAYFAQATKMPAEYVFPFQNEAIEVLRDAMKANPRDARAPYYLGNLLFDWQPAEAVRLWETSASLDPSLAIVQRNLAIAWAFGKPRRSLDRAIEHLERAVSLDHRYARHFAELDELYEAAGAAPEKRLALLVKNQEIVSGRDDSLAREIALMIATGSYDEAVRRLTGREFSVWEGGNLNVAENWTDAHVLLGQKEFHGKRYPDALRCFQAALTVPSNLPSEGIGASGRTAELSYLIGNTYEAMGDRTRAEQEWRKAAATAQREGRRPRRAERGVPPGAVQVYYRALALRKLGKSAEATALLQGLVTSANSWLSQAGAQLVPQAPVDELRRQRTRLATAHYVAGLGHLGLSDPQSARREFDAVLQVSPDHVWARTAVKAVD